MLKEFKNGRIGIEFPLWPLKFSIKSFAKGREKLFILGIVKIWYVKR